MTTDLDLLNLTAPYSALSRIKPRRLWNPSLLPSLLPPHLLPTSLLPPPLSPDLNPPGWKCLNGPLKITNFDFWLFACFRNFDSTQCPETAKAQMIIQAMPLDKIPPFRNIIKWSNFKKNKISEFGGAKHTLVSSFFLSTNLCEK